MVVCAVTAVKGANYQEMNRVGKQPEFICPIYDMKWHKQVFRTSPSTRLYMTHCRVCSVPVRLVRCSPYTTELERASKCLGAKYIFEPLFGLSLFSAVFVCCVPSLFIAQAAGRHQYGPRRTLSESYRISGRRNERLDVRASVRISGHTPHARNKQLSLRENHYSIGSRANLQHSVVSSSPSTSVSRYYRIGS